MQIMKVLFGLMLLMALVFAVEPGKTECNDAYDMCITNCCIECGGFSHYDNNYNRVCDDGNGMTSPECSSACSNCMPDYMECTGTEYGGSYGGSYPEYEGGAGCCSGFALLALITGLFAFRK